MNYLFITIASCEEIHPNISEEKGILTFSTEKNIKIKSCLLKIRFKGIKILLFTNIFRKTTIGSHPHFTKRLSNRGVNSNLMALLPK